MSDLLLEPGTVESAAAEVGRCAREKLRVVFAGGGTEPGIGGPLQGQSPLATLSTRKLSRIVECKPSDQVVTVEAGVTLAALQRTLAENQQRLSLDPPLAERATLGGIIAANSFGPLRARFGSIRDLIIGISLVRADGTVARGGGKVVKNVAGFDLPKLMCGSLGTLGLIATATLRVHPLPELSETLLVRGQSPAQVRALCQQLSAAQLEPTSVVALGESGACTVAVRFEGFGPGVRQMRDKLRAGASCELLDEKSARLFWQRHDALRTGGTLRVKITAPASAIEQVFAAFAPARAALSGAALIWYATLGLGFITGTPTPAAAAALSSLRAALVQLGGALTVHAAPDSLQFDPWGPLPAAASLMRTVKNRFDPDNRLAPGRLLGGA